jgi:1-acyl-sn-glycerol-3-phosphate acyltransferase
VRRDAAWARSTLACAVREGILSLVLHPLMLLYTRRTVTGHEHLAGLERPVLFVANHSSHMDTPLILRALPWSWRRRTAVAAAADYFYTRPVLAGTVSLAFNTVPVERKGERVVPGAENLLDRLLDQRWSLLVFAEGTRSRDGVVGRLRSGAAVLAAQHDLAIVPVHVSGTHATMPVGRSWMTRSPGGGRREVKVAFGPAIRPAADEHRTDVMERVRLFLEAEGAQTTPDKRIVAQQRKSATTAG